MTRTRRSCQLKESDLNDEEFEVPSDEDWYASDDDQAALTCALCSATFGNKAWITRHMKTEHGIQRDDEEEEHDSLSPVPSREGGIKCPLCDMVFGNQAWITRHLKTEHREDDEDSENDGVSSKSVEDGLQLQVKVVKEKSLCDDAPVFRCKVCSSCQAIVGKRDLDQHLADAHADESDSQKSQIQLVGRYRCGLCPATYYNVSSVRRHIARLHRDDEGVAASVTSQEATAGRGELPRLRVRIKCSSCAQTFGDEAALLAHVQQDHISYAPKPKTKRGPGRPRLNSLSASAREGEPGSLANALATSSPRLASEDKEKDEDTLFKQLSYLNEHVYPSGIGKQEILIQGLGGAMQLDTRALLAEHSRSIRSGERLQGEFYPLYHSSRDTLLQQGFSGNTNGTQQDFYPNFEPSLSHSDSVGQTSMNSPPLRSLAGGEAILSDTCSLPGSASTNRHQLANLVRVSKRKRRKVSVELPGERVLPQMLHRVGKHANLAVLQHTPFSTATSSPKSNQGAVAIPKKEPRMAHLDAAKVAVAVAVERSPAVVEDIPDRNPKRQHHKRVKITRPSSAGFCLTYRMDPLSTAEDRALVSKWFKSTKLQLCSRCGQAYPYGSELFDHMANFHGIGSTS